MPNRNFTTIVDSSIRHLANSSNFTALGKGSSTRNLLELMGSEIVAVYRQSEIDQNQARAGSAKHKGLELICDLFNLRRIKRSRAGAPLSDLNIRFYVDSSYANFSSLPVVPPSIDVGTTIRTSSGSDAIIYSVTESAAINPLSNIHYVGVTALQSGASFNTGANTLTTHSLDYEGLLSKNSFAIANGKNDETDEQFRYRLFNAVKSLQTSNNRSIFIASRIVPGVGDVRILRNLFGIGTFTVIVLPATGKVPSKAILATVKENIQKVIPSATKVFVTGPDVVGLEVEMTINYTKALTLTQKNSIARGASTAVRRYLVGRSLGEGVSIRDMASIAVRSNPNIKTVGTSDNALGRVWIHRSETAGDFGSRFREELLFNGTSIPTISVQAWEVVNVEDSIASSIRVIHGTEG